MAVKNTEYHKVELIDEVFSITLSYDPRKLLTLLMQLAVYEELRQQLIRRRSNKMVYLVRGPVLDKYDKVNNRSYFKYLIRVQKGDEILEFVPLRKLNYLAKKLGLYGEKNVRQLKEVAKKAEKHIQDYDSVKLGYSLMQFLFEALHAASGSPVSLKKQQGLERIGSMVDRCWPLRLAGKTSPAGLRRGDRRLLEELIKISMLALRHRKKTINFDSVAEFLQSLFEYDPILTGENLRKAVIHHGLDWKEMKKRKS